MTTAPSAAADPRLAALVDAARVAQAEFGRWPQERIDDAVTAIAWTAMQPANAERLARLAVDQTGLGNFEDKVTKVRRKTKGTLADLQRAKSVGVVEEDTARGITKIAKPMGVIAAVLPSTNPAATAVNNMMITLKGGNAVVLAPHPRGEATCAEAVRLAQVQLARIGAPVDLVQYVSLAAESKEAGKERASQLMSLCDYSLVTAGPANVDLAYRSGTPAHGVGVGNAPVIIDATADLDSAIPKVVASKTFDYATSCSSENSLLIEGSVYDEVVARLQDAGGYLVTGQQRASLQGAMFQDGHINRDVVAQPAGKIATIAGFGAAVSEDTTFLMVEETDVGPQHPFSGEKLSVVLTLYRWDDFEGAVAQVKDILGYMGLGHSCGIHTALDERAVVLANAVDVSTVLVNQAHSFNNGGSFDNGLDFTLSMGAGTWGDNDTSDNLTYRHFLNYTYLARPIPSSEPDDAELFADFESRYPE